MPKSHLVLVRQEQLNMFSFSGKRCSKTHWGDGHVWEDCSKGVVRQQCRLNL